MLGYALGVLATGLLCATWVAVQRWVAVLDPEQPGVEGHESCHSHGGDCASGSCAVESCATCSLDGSLGE